MPRTHDQEVIEAFATDGADPTLAVSIRVWRPNRSTDDLGADGEPHLIEGPSELGVAVTDQVADGAPAVVELGRQIAGLLGDPDPSRVSGDATELDPPRLDLDQDEHVVTGQPNGVHR